MKQRVEDRSAEEEYRLLMLKLTDYWRREVLREENKKKKAQELCEDDKCPSGAGYTGEGSH